MALSRNSKVVLSLVGALVVMCALTAAAVPAYRAFCNATGFAGTARKANATLAAIQTPGKKIVRVRFDTNTNGVPWSFKAEKPYFDTRVGKSAMVWFDVKNNADYPVTARATYNVLPDTMGAYFMKTQCFCFNDVTLQPGESQRFPVVYFLDPKLMENSDTNTVPDVTLSYTFFESKVPQSVLKTAS
ncbi:cytochrome c oxidase assembly protein [Asticcacaulis taihuensis]|uniref:cytochrome c oxidase assembly protein n=1 Tax=Asticcacaulis taihuensis TaxID=260084 RepID=UPI0026ECBD81|nr:cytochrome c oxidase assembly protein [Asticcacaulis taihuensis]